MTSGPRLPLAPRFNWTSGESPFAWIVEQAKRHRAARAAAIGTHRTIQYLQRTLDSRPIKP